MIELDQDELRLLIAALDLRRATWSRTRGGVDEATIILRDKLAEELT